MRLFLATEPVDRSLAKMLPIDQSVDLHPTRLDQFDRDAELKRALRTLQKQNEQLKRLVVRLSETILKNVAGSWQVDIGEQRKTGKRADVMRSAQVCRGRSANKQPCR